MEARGALRVSEVPARDAALGARLAAYQNVRVAALCGPHPSGVGCYILTRFANTAQVHHVKTAGGARRQLTFLKEPVKECLPVPRAICRAGSACLPPGFVYGVDTGGDEQLQYWFFDESNGVHTRLTDGLSVHRGARWHDTDPKLVYASNERDGTHFDLYSIEITRHTLYQGDPASFRDARAPEAVQFRRTLLYTSGDEPGYVGALHYAGKYILARHYTSVTDVRLFIVGEGGVTAVVAPSPACREAAAIAGQFALSAETGVPCGVVFASDEGTLFRTLRFAALSEADLREKEGALAHPESVPVGAAEWDVASGGIWVCQASGRVVVEYNKDGVSTLHQGRLTSARTQFDSDGFQELRLVTSDGGATLSGVISGDGCLVPAAEGGPSFMFSVITGSAPGDVYTAPLPEVLGPASAVAAATRWTESEVGGLDPSTFTEPVLVHYTSFDGLVVPAFVYAPRRRVDEGPIPVVVHPHGGPEGQHRPKFNPFYQYLTAELGICVIDPNVRGSSGYGKEYVSMDNGRRREDSVKDIGALLDWIGGEEARARFNLDASRVGVWGGSYGGYMTLASLVHYPQRLRCGIDMVGISNFVTFLENTKGYRRDLRRVKYGDERDPEMRAFLESISPSRNADRIRSPLFIVQGANDPRVPRSEAEQIHECVAKGGVPVWYMLAEDEGHGFRKKDNIDAYQEAMVAFWRRHLLAAPGGD